jgi:putative membrane protein
MRSFVTSAVLLVSASMAVAGCTAATSATPGTTSGTSLAPLVGSGSPLSSRDSAFLAVAASDAQFEIASGKLATTRAADQRLHQFGNRMVTDHGQEYQSLQAVAQASRLNLPTGPGADQRDILTIWSSLRGGPFDCSYAPAMYLGHAGVVAAFLDESVHGDSPRVRDFARNELPTLRDHLQMARQNLSGLHC